MCGIAFAFRPDLDAERLNEAVACCLDRQAHRGPDGVGQRGRAPWCLGHRRLAVIDPLGSPQPLADLSGRYMLSYNGELYNYQELRNRLGGHWQFMTRGDTEVVLAGLVIYGVEFLERMEGMWALALWDIHRQTLLLVRDRMGKKPLYFVSDHRRFGCASELRALRPLSWFDWHEDPHSTADFLRYGYFLPGTTIYKKVHEVLPGHWLKWAPGQAARQHPYWRLSPGGYTGTRPAAATQLEAALTRAVRRRLVADVEVGALLSGGVDSSLAVGIVRQRLQRELKTFTIGFSDPAYDERPYARRVAGHFATDHHDQRLDLTRSEDLIRLVLSNVAQPFGDASLMPTALVSRLAARQVKVVISGDGGDELFGGYAHYLARSYLRWYTRLPHKLRHGVAGFGNQLSKSGLSGRSIRYLNRFVDICNRMETERPYVAPVNYASGKFGQLVPDIRHKGHPAPKMPKATRWDDLQQMMVADTLIYLPQDILCKVDRASMAFSLEVRSPFLDRRVVELAVSMPRTWHHRRGRGKRMLNQAFGDLLPPWVWKRPKQGFAVPLNRWFRSGLQAKLTDLLHQTSHPLNIAFVQQMIDQHLDHRWEHGMRLWHLYIYLRWLTESGRPSI